MKARRPLGGRDGMALALAVTVVALLSILVVDFMGRAWVESASAAGYRDETKALYGARSAQEAARLALMADAGGLVSEGISMEMAMAGIPIPIGDDYAFFSVTDESGKIDLNQLVNPRGYPNDRWVETLRRLLTRLEMDPNLAWAVVDWLDADSDPRYEGAENTYYSGLKIPYKAKNARFDSVDELGLVKGFDAKAMLKIRGHVTVWSSGKLNLNTATPMALMALDDGITEGMVQDLLKARKEKKFGSIGELSKIPGFSEVFPRIALLIGVSSDFYSVMGTGSVNDASKSILAVYQRSATKTTTLYYKNL